MTVSLVAGQTKRVNVSLTPILPEPEGEGFYDVDPFWLEVNVYEDTYNAEFTILNKGGPDTQQVRWIIKCGYSTVDTGLWEITLGALNNIEKVVPLARSQVTEGFVGHDLEGPYQGLDAVVQTFDSKGLTDTGRIKVKFR